MLFDRQQSLIAFLVLALSLINACGNQTRYERWVGHYKFPESDVEFPFYMELVISGKKVTGRSVDPSDVATIRGSLLGEHYELLFHPLDQGDSTDQDIYFRGTRRVDDIVGEWEHVVGVVGPWSAKLTELEEIEALDLSGLPCID